MRWPARPASRPSRRARAADRHRPFALHRDVADHTIRALFDAAGVPGRPAGRGPDHAPGRRRAPAYRTRGRASPRPRRPCSPAARWSPTPRASTRPSRRRRPRHRCARATPPRGPSRSCSPTRHHRCSATRQLSRVVPGRRWRIASTDAGAGPGPPLPAPACADPQGAGRAVRTFTTATARATPAAAVVGVGSPRTPRPRRTAYTTTTGWYAGCTTSRVQLLATRRVDGVGDEAAV